MKERGEDLAYINLEDLAKDASNLIFQLLKDRVLRFDVSRTIEINTYFLNYFLLQNYFVAFDLQDETEFAKNLSEEESLELSSFREYIERLHGIFIMIPMIYKGEDLYSKTNTDEFINRIDIYGEFTNNFFTSSENLTTMKFDEIEKMLEDYVISHHFLPYLDFDPEFQKIIDSVAFNQLFCITRSKEYLARHNLKRFNYPVDEKISREFEDAMKRWDEKIFKFNPNLKSYSNFLSYGANYIAVKDFGSSSLMKEVIDLFREYYMLRIPSRKEEINKYMALFERLIVLVRGRLYIKIPWNKLKTELLSIHEERTVNLFLDKICLNKTFHKFPKEIKRFDSLDFIGEYNSFLNYGCYCYSGQVYTGAPLIWRSMIKYFEELQSTDEFRDQKGALLENWCLKLIEEHGFQPEKIILKNKDVEPNENYWEMKDQVKSFNKPPLEFEVEFIDHQKKYPFHEFDLVFRAEKLLYILECKCAAIRFSQSTKYVSWGSRFEKVFDIHSKKTDNLKYCIEKGIISHPLFNNLVEFIPIIIQTEGVYHGTFGFDTDTFRVVMANIKKQYEDGTLMEFFEEF